jgi:hypothetical protein
VMTSTFEAHSIAEQCWGTLGDWIGVGLSDSIRSPGGLLLVHSEPADESVSA